jgi:hypothetical protein
MGDDDNVPIILLDLDTYAKVYEGWFDHDNAATMTALHELVSAIYLGNETNCREYAQILRGSAQVLLDSDHPDANVFTGQKWSAMISALIAGLLDSIADEMANSGRGGVQ